MWNLVVPELFKDLVIHCNPAAEGKTARSLIAITSALKRFAFKPRSLQLKVSGTLEYSPLKDLLYHLPADSLQIFHCCGAWPWQRPPLFSLYMHLTSLRNLRLDRDFFFGYNRLGDVMLQAFDSITEICVEVSNLEGMSCEPLDSMDLSSLRKLEVRIESDNLPEQSETFRDDVIELNPFFKDHISRFHTLTHLTLWRIFFSTRESLDLFNLPSLTHLALMYCDRVDLSFSAFSAPALTSLHYFNKIFFNLNQSSLGRWTIPTGPDRNLSYLAKILRRFRGLETLAVRTGELSDCEDFADAILLHKETLKFLMINDSHEYSSCQSRHFIFVDVAHRCKKLSQLGLSLNGKDLPLLKHQARVSFPCNLKWSQQASANGHLVTHQQSLVTSLPFLVTLNIYRGLTENDIPLNGFYHAELAAIAEHCFKRSKRSKSSRRATPPKFSLLCIGQENKYADSGKIFTPPDSPRQCYVRRKGPYDVHASRSYENARSQRVRAISPQDARYLVGQSNIIDLDFFQFMEWS